VKETNAIAPVNNHQINPSQINTQALFIKQNNTIKLRSNF